MPELPALQLASVADFQRESWGRCTYDQRRAILLQSLQTALFLHIYMDLNVYILLQTDVDPITIEMVTCFGFLLCNSYAETGFRQQFLSITQGTHMSVHYYVTIKEAMW